MAHFLMVFEGELIHDAAGADGKITLQKGSTLSYPMLNGSNGGTVHFAFTDWSSLYQWKNEPIAHGTTILADSSLRRGNVVK